MREHLRYIIHTGNPVRPRHPRRSPPPAGVEAATLQLRQLSVCGALALPGAHAQVGVSLAGLHRRRRRGDPTSTRDQHAGSLSLLHHLRFHRELLLSQPLRLVRRRRLLRRTGAGQPVCRDPVCLHPEHDPDMLACHSAEAADKRAFAPLPTDSRHPAVRAVLVPLHHGQRGVHVDEPRGRGHLLRSLPRHPEQRVLRDNVLRVSPDDHRLRSAHLLHEWTVPV
mmetsp:Transcript_64348/g.153486  ORF Transcript_64348/g.153486 Transcript_64348/m.153486 type:complete len:224 (+) Transcript_64348:403-1074(+)